MSPFSPLKISVLISVCERVGAFVCVLETWLVQPSAQAAHHAALTADFPPFLSVLLTHAHTYTHKETYYPPE